MAQILFDDERDEIEQPNADDKCADPAENQPSACGRQRDPCIQSIG